jgi:DNA-binding transcriptional regulator YiaG
MLKLEVGLFDEFRNRFGEPTTLPRRIASQRRRLELTLKEASCAIGVDEGTFHRWKRGEWKPRMSQEAIQTFLAWRASALT